MVNPSTSVLYLIGRTDRMIRRTLEELLSEHELPVLSYTALSILAARPGLSNADLARRSFMTPQGMSQAIAILKTRGLVLTEPDPSNRRVLRIRLTAAGKKIVDASSDKIARFEADVLAPLTSNEKKQFTRMLATIIDHRDHQSSKDA